MSVLGSFRQHVPAGIRGWLKNTLLPDEARLVYDVVEHDAASGTMIDVGACAGDAFRRFAHDGWTVYAFEPDPVNRQNLARRWAAHERVVIDRRAVSNRVAAEVPFYRSDVSAGISGLSSFHDSHQRAGTVDTTTLARFCRERGITHVDFLKVDTEGFDLFVLQGMPWRAVTPRMVMCEFEDAKTRPLGYCFYDLADYLRDLGYHLLISEWYPIVTYGARHRWRRFAPYPCTLADERAWGNLIAVRDQAAFSRLIARSKKIATTWHLGAAAWRLAKG